MKNTDFIARFDIDILEQPGSPRSMLDEGKAEEEERVPRPDQNYKVASFFTSQIVMSLSREGGPGSMELLVARTLLPGVKLRRE